jgi:hypothetical protein
MYMPPITAFRARLRDGFLACVAHRVRVPLAPRAHHPSLSPRRAKGHPARRPLETRARTATRGQQNLHKPLTLPSQ